MISAQTLGSGAVRAISGAWRRISQTQWVIIAMVAGIALGYAFPDRPGSTGFTRRTCRFSRSVFLRMIKSLIVPLLFGTLVVGIAGHGDDMKRVGQARAPFDRSTSRSSRRLRWLSACWR